MLIEVHILQNHAPGNLNRDDTGSPKEAVFGGYKRARISSQCLKRSIRRSGIFQEELKDLLATRTRSLPELVRKNLITSGFDEEIAAIGARKVSGFGTKTGEEKSPNSTGHYRTGATIFLTDSDIATVSDVVASAARDCKDIKTFEKVSVKELQQQAEDKGFRPVSVDIALFGRMVTSDAFVDVDASSQFAHAISTHKVDHEFDYYTAVDDMERASDDDAGAGADMIGDIEFNSACYYKYFNVHVDGLIDNLTGRAFKRTVSSEDKKEACLIARKAVRALIEAACRVTPSGKQNSFAAHQLPGMVWIEIRDKNLPVSYANAFCNPVYGKSVDGLEVQSENALKEECEKLTEMYGLEARKRLLLAKKDDFTILGVTACKNLKTLLDETEKEICCE
ncbi:MAG: type I-E CRISPR-associated protein Cas7/Cse4/CasC [Dehalococcoidales bacterium]|nr:type I-E CRISPR-associated protein Cas7/Cse4/CasC [Dehalococcoidales bacterium]